MQLGRQAAITIALCGIAVCHLPAQDRPRSTESAITAAPSVNRSRKSKTERPLNKHERSTVIATALDSKIPHRTESDCSHLVHAIYQRAGFPYGYAPSDDLYDGIDGFERVSRPQSADLIVWHGHVGIVTRPSRHLFFSFLRAGPAIDNYQSRYWRGRGEPRFYRYLKNASCSGCRLAHNQPSE